MEENKDQLGDIQKDLTQIMDTLTDHLKKSRPILEKRYTTSKQLEEYDFDGMQWLLPSADAIKLCGRDAELKALDDFANSLSQVSIWAVTGPSGSGKTRLATEWIRNNDYVWEAGFTTGENSSWDTWYPIKPTFIVIDYFALSRTVSEKIIARAKVLASDSGDTPHLPVRILILDHIFDENNLTEDTAWKGIVSSAHDKSLLKSNDVFYIRDEAQSDKIEPLSLSGGISDVALKGIIDQVAGDKAKEEDKQAALERVQTTQGARHPLFAALAGYAVKKDIKTAQGSRRALIEKYFISNNRLVWKSTDAKYSQAGLIAAGYVCCSTPLGEVAFKKLSSSKTEIDAQRIKDNSGLDKVAFDLATRIVGRDAPVKHPTLVGMQPDIMGETYLLLFLQHLQDPIYHTETEGKKERLFTTIIGNEATAKDDTVTRAAHNSVLEFCRRMSLNIANEDADYTEVWLDFLATEPSPENQEKINSVLLQNSIVEASNGFLANGDVDNSAAALKSFKPKVLLAAKDDSFKYRIIFSVFAGNTRLIDKLLQAGWNPNQAKTDNGATALMAASEAGQVDIVKHLLEAKADVNQATTDKGLTALLVASADGHVDIVEHLIEQGADVNQSTTDKGWTALLVASADGHLDIVNHLLDAGAKVDQGKTDDGFTALMAASAAGHLDIVKHLILKDAKANQASTYDGTTALMFASQQGHLDIVEYLIEQGADINHARTDNGVTALPAASANGHLEVVKHLIEHEADINQARTDDGATALLAASYKGHLDIVEYLIEREADVNNAITDKGVTALLAASQNGHQEVVKHLIEQGADINQARTDDGATALLAATYKGHLDIVEYLIEREADVNQAKTDNEATAKDDTVTRAAHNSVLEFCRRMSLNIANEDASYTEVWLDFLATEPSQIDQEKINSVLLQNSIVEASNGFLANEDVDNSEAALNNFKPKVFHAAVDDSLMVRIVSSAVAGNICLIDKLLQAGWNPNQARTDDGATALMGASFKGHHDIVKHLIEQGAAINQAKTDNGATALIYASAAGHLDIVKHLILKDAKANQARTDDGATALMFASQNGHQEVVKHLLDAGADVNQSTTDKGETALMVASEEGHIDIVEYLISKGANNK